MIDCLTIKLLENINLNPPAPENVFCSVQSELGISLPEQYRWFILHYNGGEGFLGSGPYLILWKIEELVDNNREYEGFYPGLVFFGTDGGGEGFAFDTRDPKMPVINVPLIGDFEDAIPMGETFAEFIKRIAEFQY